MLKGDRLFFRYESTPWIIESLDFAIRPGEIVGLPGPSGRGKSTLAKLLAGHLAPQQGAVTCDGQTLPTRRFCPVQLIFQHPELTMNPRWKLGDSLNEGWRPDGRTLEALNIEPAWLSRYPHELSGGELQRLALARIMSPETHYLLADEMTAMLDPNTQALVWDAVLDWAARYGVGVLAISHDRHLLNRVSHRIDDTFAPEEFLEPQKPCRAAA
ncbi:ATP-binding cassette domain-containing protein [Pseudodesulfovibrio cashew]|uniref:ATP-binding cassette domain-containing protein n=1 Tax=Pseudodesulfovibrio cashew TaxID=2678688 RepID=A0A6I6JKY8_9BACT|nr:ATP-binding cassette domain-containing protein [Pseudodesulfovibrio cashew]QGY41859.1 ATP-binding cassette domain-containing protein [Pseudodesulfovibrio cashew]